MLMVLLIYAIAKTYHLPALIFILLFGLFLGNSNKLKHNKYIQKLKPDALEKEVHKFKELIIEIVFLIRTLFFIVFGFVIETSELLNSQSIVWALGICAAIFGLRFIFLSVFKVALQPLLFIAPRGLITILLFLSIPAEQSIALANKSLIIQVIILTALIMMLGLLFNKPQAKQATISQPE